MKIGIITFHDATNYGAALQAVATYKVFSERCDCFLIDYYNKTISGQMRIINTINFRKAAHDVLRFQTRYKIIRNFRRFLEDNVKMTDRVKTKLELENAVRDFDLIIAGSDQIWNPECQTYSDRIDFTYFLDVEGSFKRASYASSFGDYRFDNNQEAEIVKRLSRFDWLSSRELDSTQYLIETLEKDVEHVLDPTLLLDKEDWLTMADSCSMTLPDDFILVYQLNKSEINKAAIEHVKRIKNIKDVIVIDQGFFDRYKEYTQIRTAGPAEFIRLFDKASCVVTDSFHGCCFSLSFRKQFVAVLPPKRANRITSLLDVLGLEGYAVGSLYDLKELNLEQNLDNVHEKLVMERQRSLSYINRVIDAVA